MLPLRILVLLAAGLGGCSPGAETYRTGETGEVVAVRGPLTLELETGADRIEVRLAELDAPDAARSRAMLERGVLGRTVRLGYAGDERDRYGRALAQVYLDGDAGEEVWLQERLVAAGAARVLSHAGNRTAARHLLERETAARAARLGLWADPAHAVRDTHPDALAQDIGSVQLVEGRVVAAEQMRSAASISISGPITAPISR